MKVIGIDQSYTGFGYCVDGEPKKKAFPVSKYRGDLVRLWQIRRWFRGWLNDVIAQDERTVDLIVMEGYAAASKYGRESAGELGAVVKLVVLDEWGSEPLIVPPSSLKKFVTGKGNAAKNQMLLGVYKQWGLEFSDDNQADAFALEKFGYAYLANLSLNPDREWSEYPKYQQETVAKVHHLTMTGVP